MATEALKSKTKKTLRFRVHSGAAVREVELQHVVDGANSAYAAGLYSLAEPKFRNPQNVSELVLAISGEEGFPGAVLGKLEEVAPNSVIDRVAEAMMGDEDTFTKIAELEPEERQKLAVDYLAHERQQEANQQTAGHAAIRELVQLPVSGEPELALAA